jgi:hypothetical protein
MTLEAIEADLDRERYAGHMLRAFGVPNMEELFQLLDSTTGKQACWAGMLLCGCSAVLEGVAG